MNHFRMGLMSVLTHFHIHEQAVKGDSGDGRRDGHHAAGSSALREIHGRALVGAAVGVESREVLGPAVARREVVGGAVADRMGEGVAAERAGNKTLRELVLSGAEVILDAVVDPVAVGIIVESGETAWVVEATDPVAEGLLITDRDGGLVKGSAASTVPVMKAISPVRQRS